MTKAFEYVLGVFIAKIFLMHTKIESGAFLSLLKNIIVSSENTNIVNFNDWSRAHHG